MALTYPILLDTRNKNIHGLGVGISTVLKILRRFLFKGRQDHPRKVMTYICTYHQMICNTMKNLFSYFNFLGVGLILGVMTYITIGCSLTQGTRIYMV
jgi:hypothetical protein